MKKHIMKRLPIKSRSEDRAGAFDLKLILLAAAVLSGCGRIGESVAVSGTVSDLTSLTAMPPVTETENTADETVFSEETKERSVTEDTFAKTAESDEFAEVGGEPGGETPKDNHTTNVESISLTFYSAQMTVGERKMPIVTMLPADASDKGELWESSDPSVAEVDGLGNITAVSEGSCAVKVTSSQNPEVFAEVEVTVSAAPQFIYFQGILIANKTYALPADYAPGVQPEALSAFEEMRDAAAAEGLNIYISSGFRSYDYQAGLYDRYVQRSGQAEADRYSARAGHSEHQTGLAFDLNTITDEFKDTDEGKWVAANCCKYGFIIRYPADKESVTGYMYEPWHIRYLGRETAQAVYDSGLCLEEYLGINSEYDE